MVSNVTLSRCGFFCASLIHDHAIFCCKGPGGGADGYRGLQEAVGCRERTPMVPIVTDFTDFCFSSQLLLIDTNKKEQKMNSV
jgi:hypothetical protein